MAGIGDYQGLCVEYEEDIKKLHKEIERLNAMVTFLRKDNKKLMDVKLSFMDFLKKVDELHQALKEKA